MYNFAVVAVLAVAALSIGSTVGLSAGGHAVVVKPVKKPKPTPSEVCRRLNVQDRWQNGRTNQQ